MGRKRTILILGAGVMQLPAIRAAQRLGLRTFVVDGNPSAPGIAEADRFEPIDLRHRESILEAARKQRRDGQLHAVFTAGTDFSASVAFVARALDLPGTSLESAENATDKFRMRRVLRDAGVRVPDFAVLESDQQTEGGVRSAISTVGLPCVVKPADSMGARGVVRADTAEEAIAFSVAAAAHSRTNRVVVEGFIDGPEFSVDALVYDGEVMVTGFADRHIRFAPYFIEVGHTIPSLLHGPEYDGVIEEFKRGVAALGISNGAAKGDMKLSQRGPVVGEIAARLSGGYMSGWTYPLSSGIELTEQAIRIALGEPPGSLAPVWNRTSAERAIISIPGTIETIEGDSLVRDRPEVAEIFLTRSAGDQVDLPTSNVEKCGNVIAVTDEHEPATEAAERAVATVEVVLVPDNSGTDRFLFGNDDQRWAYPPNSLDSAWVRDRGILETVWPDRRIAAGEEPVGIGKLPEKLPPPDWSWRSLSDTVARLEKAGLVTNKRYDQSAAPAVWRAILKGGLQGGRYVIRSRFLRRS